MQRKRWSMKRGEKRRGKTSRHSIGMRQTACDQHKLVRDCRERAFRRPLVPVGACACPLTGLFDRTGKSCSRILFISLLLSTCCVWHDGLVDAHCRRAPRSRAPSSAGSGRARAGATRDEDDSPSTGAELERLRPALVSPPLAPSLSPALGSLPSAPPPPDRGQSRRALFSCHTLGPLPPACPPLSPRPARPAPPARALPPPIHLGLALVSTDLWTSDLHSPTSPVAMTTATAPRSACFAPHARPACSPRARAAHVIPRAVATPTAPLRSTQRAGKVCLVEKRKGAGKKKDAVPALNAASETRTRSRRPTRALRPPTGPTRPPAPLLPRPTPTSGARLFLPFPPSPSRSSAR